MTPDDPRHGTYAGYQAHHENAGGTACPSCQLARLRARKKWGLELLAGEQMVFTWEELLDMLSPWLTQGLGPSAIADAAGIGSHRGAKLLQPGRPVRRSTFHALAAVTEADLNPRSKLWSHLTEQRVGSLMAAGHKLTDMPINPRGQFRYRDRISVALARAVRDHYDEYQDTSGNSAGTRTRALNAGHRPPAAWDDPGTLAWPLDWTEPIVISTDIDPVVVDRVVIYGLPKTHCTPAERREVVRRWVADGRSLNSLGLATGWKVDRYLDPTPADEVA